MFRNTVGANGTVGVDDDGGILVPMVPIVDGAIGLKLDVEKVVFSSEDFDLDCVVGHSAAAAFFSPAAVVFASANMGMLIVDGKMSARIIV